MKNQSSGNEGHADTIIRNHVVWSMGAGMIPVLIADIFAVSAIQLDMIRQMTKIYDVEFNELQGKAIVTSLTSSAVARLAAGSVVKLIPGIGSLIGGVTISAFAGASTYALGEVFKKHFESGGTILDFDPDRVRQLYKEKFEKGKKMAQEWAKKVDSEYNAEPDSTENNGGFTIKEKPKAETIINTDVEEIVETPLATPNVESNSIDTVERLKDLAALKKAKIITEAEFKKLKKKIMDEA